MSWVIGTISGKCYLTSSNIRFDTFITTIPKVMKLLKGNALESAVLEKELGIVIINDIKFMKYFVELET